MKLRWTHEKADTVHYDVSLGTTILCRPKETMERVGYLTDWELSCELSKVAARERASIVRSKILFLDDNSKMT